MECAAQLSDVVVVGRRGCPHTESAIALLMSKNVQFNTEYIDDKGDACETLWRKYGTFPQILFFGIPVPGGNQGLQQRAASIPKLAGSREHARQVLGPPKLWLDEF